VKSLKASVSITHNPFQACEKLFRSNDFVPDTFTVDMNGYNVNMMPSPLCSRLAHINLLGAEFAVYCDILTALDYSSKMAKLIFRKLGGSLLGIYFICVITSLSLANYILAEGVRSETLISMGIALGWDCPRKARVAKRVICLLKSRLI